MIWQDGTRFGIALVVTDVLAAVSPHEQQEQPWDAWAFPRDCLSHPVAKSRPRLSVMSGIGGCRTVARREPALFLDGVGSHFDSAHHEPAQQG
jgi:hypothetical protein